MTTNNEMATTHTGVNLMERDVHKVRVLLDRLLSHIDDEQTQGKLHFINNATMRSIVDNSLMPVLRCALEEAKYQEELYDRG